MKLTPHLVTAALLAFGLSLPAWGNTYHGTITCTVTSIFNAPPGTLSVGDTFGGWYQYESPSVDGTFYGHPNILGGELLLVGGLDLPYPITFAKPSGFYGFDIQHSTMVVTGGVVMYFNWHPTLGPTDLNVDTASFGFTYSLLDIPARGSGTVVFSAPTVPDSSGTMILIIAAIIGLFGLRFFAKSAQPIS
jgi:hypothetical protein